MKKKLTITAAFSAILICVAILAVILVMFNTIGWLSLMVIAGVVGYLAALVLIAKVPSLSQKIEIRKYNVDYERRANLSNKKTHLKIVCVSSFIILAWLLNTYVPTGSMFEKEFKVVKKIEARPRHGWELVLRYDKRSTAFLMVSKSFWHSVSIKEKIILDLQSGMLGFDVIHNYRKSINAELIPDELIQDSNQLELIQDGNRIIYILDPNHELIPKELAQELIQDTR